MRIVVPTASLAAGTIAASLTFTTMTYAGEATVGVANIATRAVSFVAGRGVNLVFGPVSSFIAQQTSHDFTANTGIYANFLEKTINEFGDQLLAPVIRTGSQKTAYLTSAAVGTAVIAASTILIHAGTWIYQKGYTAMYQYLKQTPIKVDSRICDIGRDMVLVTIEEDDTQTGK